MRNKPKIRNSVARCAYVNRASTHKDRRKADRYGERPKHHKDLKDTDVSP